MHLQQKNQVMEVKINHKTIYTTLKEEIANGHFPAGSLLPTEQTLAQKYSVSRPTIAKVYNQLQAEGYLKKTKGLGTIVVHENMHDENTFGLLLPGAGESEIFSIINDQLLKLAESEQFNCLWEGATASSADIRRTLIEICSDNYIKRRVDGIFFSPLERVPDANKINIRICEEIKKADIPLILIDRDVMNFPERSKFDLVSLDNFNAGCLMAQHLVDAGCEMIHYFYRPDSANSVMLRLSGIKDVVQKHNLSFTRDNVHCGNPEDVEFVKQISVIPGKTGIICANDSTAAVLMSSIDAIGLKISQDLLICGFDNMKYSQHLKHALTSFKQPCEEIANVSVELMMRRIRNRNAVPVTVNLTGEIISRDSSVFIQKKSKG